MYLNSVWSLWKKQRVWIILNNECWLSKLIKCIKVGIILENEPPVNWLRCYVRTEKNVDKMQTKWKFCAKAQLDWLFVCVSHFDTLVHGHINAL